MKPRFNRILSILLAVLILAGCATNPAYEEGRTLVAAGQDERALEKYRTAKDEDPANGEYRAAYIRLRERLLGRWLEQGLAARSAGKRDDAVQFFRRVLDEDPANARARNGLADLQRDARHEALLAEAEAALKRRDDDTAMNRLRTILGENPEQARALELRNRISDASAADASPPQLAAALGKPITIEFKEAQLRQIFEVLSRTSGLNFVFDKDVRGEQRATIFLRNSSIRDALNLLLLTNQLEQRVLDAHSILIYPNTAAKQKDYQALTVKTFFLSNVEAKSAAANLKTIVRTKDIVVDEKQNMITVRDTPDAVRMAEKLLALYDLPEPEVMLEVTVLEVSRSRLLNLGIQWPDQLSLAPLAGSSGSVTLADLKNLNSDGVGATLSSMTFNAKKTDGDTNILANPRIRAHNKETAKIMIGDRIPNITTTSTSTGFVSENIQYIDVGLKVEVQPTVYADNEVAIKVSLEVSSIAGITKTASGSSAYQIGTRNASTVLRLKDGENQILAGLIRDDATSTGNKVPGLGDIPVLGRLFGSQNDQSTKTEIILSITPHLIRDARRPDFRETEFDSGSESMLRLGPQVARRVPVEKANVSGASSESMPGTGTTPTMPAVHSSEEVSPDGNETPAPPQATGLRLQGPTQVKAGASFSVELLIDPGEPVSSVPLALSFDPKVLEVTGVTEGDFLAQDNGTTKFSSRVDGSGGQVFATVTRAGRDGATHPGRIVALQFKALAATGTSSIQVTAATPIGVGGRLVNVAPPLPLQLSVTP
jgi:general secretion pathway protein D